jgi:4,5-dihydroxyphthalate decarboxylase
MRKITLACWDYDRTLPLADGRVDVEGVDLTYLHLPVEETFFRMARFKEFDVAEMSLSTYLVSLGQDKPFVAIPVFPSRSFRHNGVYVNTKAGIERPKDLIGRVVGVPEYQLTACVWIRGILAEHEGVPVASVAYRTGGLRSPGRVEKLAVAPAGIDISPIDPGRTLDELLTSGELDAIYAPRTPPSFLEGHPAVRRLWADPKAAELSYYRVTGIFPIMHTVVLRRDRYEEAPWLAGALYKAFCAAKALVQEGLDDTAASLATLPWTYAAVAEAKELLGEEYWPYGIERNRTALATFARYAHEQGLTDRVYEPEELFAPETHQTYVI